MSQIEDLEAINEYMTSQPLNTNEAKSQHDSWIKWYSGLSALSKRFSTEVYNEARNRRAMFNQANAKTTEEKKFAQQVAATGISTEQTQGQPDQRLSDGSYSVPLIPTRYLIGGGVIAVVAAAGYAAYKTARARIPFLP